ncbi:MAG TPA: ABC transporter substrate-binding protein [Noviherbaspirillum sp.]|jgi:peptide/nickel transport system substrate-binding protein
MQGIFKWACAVVVVAGACIASGAAAGSELKIGFKADITSADPHILGAANRGVWAHVYESLVQQDEQLRPKPGLALSWKAVEPTVWEFKLRPNVSFHNGAPFTADDVKYSIERAMHITGPRTFRTYLRGIDSVSVAGPLTVRVKTLAPEPALPDNLGLIPILPKSLGANATEESFTKGTSAIGTGPYKFAGWTHGEKVTLVKNPNYWGDKEPWDTVVFQIIQREPARASALLAGTVDIIDGATTKVADTFGSSNKIDTVAITSYMLNYLQFDTSRDNTPDVKSKSGQPLGKNPLQDKRVRLALMSAVNRDGIIRFLMKGDAVASEQFVPEGFFGHDNKLKAPSFDLAKAKSLLAEAGYPDGFKMTIHCTNDRYVNDAKMCEAIAQSFSQIGLKVDIAAMPYAVLIGRVANQEFSAWTLGTGAVTGDSLQPLTSLVHTQDKKSGAGANNYGHYSNKEIDSLIDKAARSLDEHAREDLQKTAAKAAIDDGAIVPLVNIRAAWAFRKGLTIKPRADGMTLAMSIRERAK